MEIILQRCALDRLRRKEKSKERVCRPATTWNRTASAGSISDHDQEFLLRGFGGKEGAHALIEGD